MFCLFIDSTLVHSSVCVWFELYAVYVTCENKPVSAPSNPGNALSSSVSTFGASAAACPALRHSTSCTCTSATSKRSPTAHFPILQVAQTCVSHRQDDAVNLYFGTIIELTIVAVTSSC